jgi:CRP/FNR family transcriptional activator FtrB
MGVALSQKDRLKLEDNARLPSPEDIVAFSQLPLFCTLNSECLRRVTADARVVRYQRGDVLFHQGEQARWLHILVDGQIGLVGSVSGGEETIVEILKSGEVFIAAAVLTGKPYLMSAKALTTARLLLLPGDRLLGDLRDNPDLALNMLASLAKHFRMLVSEVKDLKLKSASQRLALYLMSLTNKREGSAILHLPHNKILIAGRVGVRPETLSRVFQALKKEGVVSENQTVAITDLKRLAAFCQEGDEII